jgi:hypothetical protein
VHIDRVGFVLSAITRFPRACYAKLLGMPTIIDRHHSIQRQVHYDIICHSGAITVAGEGCLLRLPLSSASQAQQLCPPPQTRSDCLLAVQIRLKLQKHRMLPRTVKRKSGEIRRRQRNRIRLASLRKPRNPFLPIPAHGMCPRCRIRRRDFHS